jgi:hypothetical protein
MSIEPNLFGARDYDILWKPSMEYVLGSYLATKAPKQGAPRVFENAKDAVMAYRRGDITVDTPVRIEPAQQKRIQRV